MSSFAKYLETHDIDPLRLSAVAGVRYLTIWNASKGNPISCEHAQKILRAVVSLTGIHYSGPLPVLDAIDDIPTIPIKKVTRPYRERTVISLDGRGKS